MSHQVQPTLNGWGIKLYLLKEGIFMDTFLKHYNDQGGPSSLQRLISLLDFFFIEVYFTYSVVLISSIQQSDSVILYVCVLSHFSSAQLFVTLWTIACQAPLLMRLSRQQY